MAGAFVPGSFNFNYFANGSAVSSESLPYSANVSAGNLLFVAVAWSGVGVASSVADTVGGGNAWNALTETITGAHNSQAFWCINKAGGANTVTASFSGLGGTFVQLTVAEYSGVNTVDNSAFGTAIVSNSGIPVVTSKIDGVIVGYFGAGGTNWVASSPWNGRTSGTTEIILLDQVGTLAAGTYTPTTVNGTVSSAAVIGFYNALHSISGNAGVASATVSWTGTASGSTTADGSGNYTIPSLADGNYVITPSLASYTFSPTSHSETLSGSNITGVNFTATFVPPIAGSRSTRSK